MGIVAIGRNEGPRLIGCLRSAVAALPRESVIYVDSGSGDESLKIAREMGVAVFELDHKSPFTAARARNTGLEQLRCAQPRLKFFQFVDGDCELVDGWLQTAERFLAQRPDVAVVCGRTRERYPERSLYNWLCDQEWKRPIGEAEACGGNAMFRVAAFEQVGGFRSNLGAGEEPELCLRFRERDWKVWRLDTEMAVHDADITRFGQWWRRTARGGYAYAEVSQLHKTSAMQSWQWEKMRAIIWASIIPLLLVAGGFLNKLAFAAVLIYPAQVCRIAIRHGAARADSWVFAIFMMLAKFAEMQGLTRYYFSRWRGQALRFGCKNAH